MRTVIYRRYLPPVAETFEDIGNKDGYHVELRAIVPVKRRAGDLCPVDYLGHRYLRQGLFLHKEKKGVGNAFFNS